MTEDEIYFSRDTVDIVSANSDDASLSASETLLDAAERVTIEDTPWSHAFDTDEFLAFPATVARPIEQTYVVDGTQYTFKKPAEELQASGWLLDNVPIALGHPDGKILRRVDDIHGFGSEPRYDTVDDAPDRQRARVYIPTTDEEAREWVREHGHLSVGFFNRLDWDTDEEGVDAYQRDLNYDHVAIVRHGRCSREDGCGIAPSFTVAADAVRTSRTKAASPSAPEMSAPETGDWVSWESDGDVRHGQVVYVDDERAIVRTFEDGELTETTIGVATSNLTQWAGPNADACGGDECRCGIHMGGDAADSPDGWTADDSAGGIEWRGTKDGDLDESAIPNDDYESHYVFDADTKSDSSFPLVDADGYLRRENVIAAASYADDAPDQQKLMRVLRAVNDEFDDPPLDEDTISTDTMTDDNENESEEQSEPSLAIDDLSVDAVAERHDGVAALVDERDELEAKLDEKADTIEALKEQKSDLEASFDAYREQYAERKEMVEDIVALTDKWDEEDMLDPIDGPDMDTLEERHDALTDASASATALGDSEDADAESPSAPETSENETELETRTTSDGATVFVN